MKRFIILLSIMIIAVGAIIFKDNIFLEQKSNDHDMTDEKLPKIKSKQEEKELLPLLDGDLFDMIGKKDSDLMESLEKPDRKDLSAYGYTWWLYTNGTSNYIQFGVEDGVIETIFATGEDVSMHPFEIGNTYEEMKEQFDFEHELTYRDGLSFYTFMLSEDDLEANPLIKLSDDVFLVCHFDTMKETLSSIRLISGDTLLKQRLYEMEYRGELPDKPKFDRDTWAKIEKGMEAQIFDLTNVYRHRFGLNPVKKDKQVQEVAYLHSKDMSENNYFSHYSQDSKGLKDRLGQKDIYYMTAGENIAAQHTDAPAAMEGWLNSEGHREALLNEEYTHLGVGVYELFYTQNYLYKP